MNCLFTEKELQEISCPGKLVKILGTAQDKRLACMNKCVATDYVTEANCLEYCPETLECVLDNSKYVCKAKVIV